MAEAKTQIATNEVFDRSSQHTSQTSPQQNRWQYAINIILCPSLINSVLILRKSSFEFSPTRHVHGQSIQMLSQIFVFIF